MMRLWTLLPSAERRFDTLGHLRKFITVLDGALADLYTYIHTLFTRDASTAPTSTLDVLAGNRAMEAFEVTETSKRRLIENAVSILGNKGIPQVLRFLFYEVLGYTVEVSIAYAKQWDVSDDWHSVGYDDGNAIMAANIDVANDIASYSYDPTHELTTVTYQVTNYDNEPSKLEMMHYLIRKYSTPVNYEITTA